MVVGKHEKKVIVLGVAILSDSNIRKKESQKPEKYKRLEEDVRRKGFSGTCDNRNIQGCDPQAEKLAPTNLRNKI